MKRLTFTGVVEVYDDEIDNPSRFVEMALLYGHKHQDFSSYHTGGVVVEDVEED